MGDTSNLYTRNLTCNLKRSPQKRKFPLETIIFRFHVKFWGDRIHPKQPRVCFIAQITFPAVWFPTWKADGVPWLAWPERLGIKGFRLMDQRVDKKKRDPMMDLYMVHIPYRFYILPYKMKQMYGKDTKIHGMVTWICSWFLNCFWANDCNSMYFLNLK